MFGLEVLIKAQLIDGMMNPTTPAITDIGYFKREKQQCGNMENVYQHQYLFTNPDGSSFKQDYIGGAEWDLFVAQKEQNEALKCSAETSEWQ